MAHMRRAEGYEQDFLGDNLDSDDEDDLDIVSATRKDLADGSDYIQGIAETSSATASDDDVIEITSSHTNRKGKRKAGERVEWSEEEEDDAYEKFKKRKTNQRKKVAASRKKLKTRAKDAVVGLRQSKFNSGESSEKKPRVYDDDEEDDDMLEDALPEYLKERREKFEKSRERFKEAALRLPPDYDGLYFSDDERLADLEERPAFDCVATSRAYADIPLPHSLGLIPAPIAQYLRDYQVDGVSFLHELFVYQKGGILGDDMGLGKTVQVIAFLTAAFGKTGDERDGKRMRKMRRAGGGRWYPQVLVVCPGSLIENWKQEFGRWGWWHIDSFHGDSKDDIFQSAKAGRLEVVITTYQTYKMHKSRLNLIAWDCVVADECHQLKERTSETTKAMNEVNAMCRIGLTGTAIQNNYEELWTILNWTNPGRFGPISVWKSTISGPLQIGQSHEATIYQLSRARTTAKKLVNNLLPQFFLRRMKSLIAHQLPKKSDKVVFCPLTDVQRDAYERFLESDIVDIVRNAGYECECKSGKKKGWCCHALLPNGDKWQILVFPIIATLQKLSNHLALLIPSQSDLPEKRQRDLDFLMEMVPDRWQDLYNNRDSLFNLANPEFCGKWKVLKKLLRFWHGNGDKVLVFSHSVKLLKMLHHLFHNTSYNVSFLDGSMSYEDRQKEVDDFNSDPAQFVFLISTKAGGVGLNITSANKVVIFDPNWNPAYDLQAQDRAYRIGQVRDVEVFRLVSAGTVEEIVYARQIYKQQQANIGYNASMERRYFKGVQSQAGHKGELFGLENLMTYYGDDVVLRDIVNKTNVAEAKAGVNLMSVDMDNQDDDNPLKVDDGNEDAAMTQLAALLTDEGGPSASARSKKTVSKGEAAVHHILASAGVVYTHENSEVVGSSKVEAHLSRKAEETGTDTLAAEEVLFASTQRGGTELQYTFHPSEDVMRRQFCTMAKMFGFNNAMDFALIVESWTQEQRRNCLETFYRRRKEVLAVAEGEGVEVVDLGLVYGTETGDGTDVGNGIGNGNGNGGGDIPGNGTGNGADNGVGDTIGIGVSPPGTGLSNGVQGEEDTTDDDDDEL